jgi:hypothetical protein
LQLNDLPTQGNGKFFKRCNDAHGARYLIFAVAHTTIGGVYLGVQPFKLFMPLFGAMTGSAVYYREGWGGIARMGSSP